MMVKFNRSQTLGLDIDRHIAIDAGAGTGKTTVMASRYIQHLLSREQRSTILLPPAPRIPLKGQGAIRCPSRERTSLDEWPGLLPTETVAITFTRKAAAELKARIRKLITALRATPTDKDDEHGIHDSRLRNQGDVAMLLSLIDDAPISTIDSFLSSIVTPWIGIVSEEPATEQIDEDSSILLREEAIRAAWRLQTTYDAVELGLTGNIDQFLESRNRLSLLLGGQQSSSTVIRGMMKKSLFVEEASRNLVSAGYDSLNVSDFDHLFLEPVSEFIDDWYDELRGNFTEWCDAWLDGGAGFVLGADELVGMTRFRYVQFLCSYQITNQMEKLQWIWLATHAVIAASNLKKLNCNPFSYSRPPGSKGWPSGVLAKKNCPLQKSVQDMITQNASHFADEIKAMVCTNRGFLLRNLGKASFLLNPLLPEPDEVPGQIAHPPRLEISIPQTPPASDMKLTTELELRVMKDLFVVHKGVKEILTRLKVLDGVKDHDDMHRLAEDLLLTRCPTVCRKWYPTPVIDALDSMEEQPWLDNHLNRAIAASEGIDDVHQDLMRRIEILRDMRRQFRAFIIDEYQDTNPQHFRLLARLWGRRKLESNEPAPPAGQWDPTICIVGDMKQSIYRFRQAEVTVMKRAVEQIRTMNREELLMENRLSHLREEDSSRDPRPIPGKGGDSSTFVKSSELVTEDSKRNERVYFLLDDNDEKLSKESQERRAEGHIEMSTNHRTLPKLMHTLNDIFQDTFSERHHVLPGPWHANAQNLNPGRKAEDISKLEWILPARLESQQLPIDSNVVKDPFMHDGSKDLELCADLLAKRIAALVNKNPVRVFDSNAGDWLEVDDSKGDYRPEDVMILVSSRKRIPMLVKALENHGVPAMADKQGLLLHRPVIKPLMSLLWLLTNPKNRTAALAVARSVLIGMNDEEISSKLREEGNQIELLINSIKDKHLNSLISRLYQLSADGHIRDAIEAAIDHSDLLYFYPKEGDRQDVENWLNLYDKISKQVGEDPAIIFNRLKELKELGKDGPKSSSPNSSGAVEILTIHSSKGLESPIVVLYDIFSTGTRDSSFSSSDNVLVTPNIVAGRIHPWRGSNKPESGTWTLANLFDDGQQLAERRRQFYVSLTRARDRMIFVGAPSKESTIAPNGSIRISRGEGRQNMGYMLLDGLSHSSIVAGNEGCVWSQDGLDQTGATLEINPAELLNQSYLGSNSVDGISIFHHPSCFSSSSQDSVVNQWKTRMELSRKPTNLIKEKIPINENFVIPMASHSLDTSSSCKRRFWLSTKLNWTPERMEFIPSEIRESYWPKATDFGSLFHRLLEIGLPNPGSSIDDLDNNWTMKQNDLLTDSKTINQVIGQSQISDSKLIERTSLRLSQLGELTRRGNLGILTSGEVFDGFTLEGLRTELPFYHSVETIPIDLFRKNWSPQGSVVASKVESIEAIFNGRIDLVLALRDESGQGWLQVVDAKTTGCLNNFNFENPLEGHDLQTFTDINSPFATTPSEEEIIQKHRLQLALYCLALEKAEDSKPEEIRRKILPPAIHVAASGRVIRMRDDEYEEAIEDLYKLIHWSNQILASEDEQESPQRLPMAEMETCKQCPFYNGDIRICGPIGEKLGPS